MESRKDIAGESSTVSERGRKNEWKADAKVKGRGGEGVYTHRREELCLPVVVRKRPFSIHSSCHEDKHKILKRGTVKERKYGNLECFSILPSATPKNSYLAFGCKDGSVVVGNTNDGPKYIFSCHSKRVINVMFCTSSLGELILVSVSNDGLICIWGPEKGTCIHKKRICPRGAATVSSCCTVNDKVLYVGWQDRAYVTVIDLWEGGFEACDLLFEVVHGVKDLKLEGNMLVCTDNLGFLHKYDGDSLQYTFSSKDHRTEADLGKEKDTQRQELESHAKAFFKNDGLEPSGRKTGNNLLILTPGNIGVIVQRDKLVALAFPSGKGLLSPRTKSEDSKTKILDPRWDFLLPGDYEDVLSERILLASRSGEISVWSVLIRDGEPKEGEPPAVCEVVMPWSRVLRNQTSNMSGRMKIHCCPGLKSRRHDRFTETRALICIVSENEIIILCIKRVINVSSDTKSWKWALLHRIPLQRPTSTDVLSEPVYWDLPASLLHVSNVGTWCLLTGRLDRTHSEIGRNHVFWDHAKKEEEIGKKKRRVQHHHYPQFRFHFPSHQSHGRFLFPAKRRYLPRSRHMRRSRTNELKSENERGKRSSSSGPKSRRREIAHQEDDEQAYSSAGELRDMGTDDEMEIEQHFSKSKLGQQQLQQQQSALSLGSALGRKTKGFSVLQMKNGDMVLLIRIKAILSEMNSAHTKDLSSLGLLCGGALSLLMQWGTDRTLDDQVQKVFGLSPPRQSMQLAYSYVTDILVSDQDFSQDTSPPQATIKPAGNTTQSFSLKRYPTNSSLDSGSSLPPRVGSHAHAHSHHHSHNHHSDKGAPPLISATVKGAEETEGEKESKFYHPSSVGPPGVDFYTQEHSYYSSAEDPEEFMFSSLWQCAGSQSLYRWGVSDKLTALHALGLMSLFIGAMAKFNDDSRAQAVLSSLVTHYGIVYPEHFRRQQGKYCYPNLEMVAKSALDPESHDIQVAARLLLQVSIERLPAHLRVSAASQWAARLHKPLLYQNTGSLHSSNSSSSGKFEHNFSSGHDSHVVMILAVMGVTHPEDLDTTTAKLVTKALTEYIAFRTPNCLAFAAELLARGYHLWFPYIHDRQRLIRDLLNHADSQNNLDQKGSEQSQGVKHGKVEELNKGFHRTLSVSAACQRALIEIGTKQPLDFLKTVGREAVRPDMKPDHHRRALAALAALVKKQPVALVNHLPAVVEVIIKTLDPSESALRKSCLKSSTMVLHQLVKRYPMVAFQQHTQRFAVGSVDAIIIIYDLRTATKWRILEGHTSPVTAVCFEDNTGDQIASYASNEGSLRIWQTGTAGIFATILGIKGKCIKKFDFDPVEPALPTVNQLRNVNLQWGKRKVILTKEDKDVSEYPL